MPPPSSRFGLAFAAVFLLLLTSACGGPSALQRGSLSAPPTIDGALGEWGGSLSYVSDQPVSMSVVPTDSLLYVALATQDQRLIRSVARQGLIVWVDPSGGEARKYGIQYPLGLRAQRAAGGGPPSSAASPSGSPRRSSAFSQLSLQELDVLRRDSARVRIPAQFSSGVRAQATINPGTLVYEVAIPVAAAAGTDSTQHGLRTPLAATVSVGLQTPEADEETNVRMPTGNLPSVTGRRGRSQRGRQPRQRQRTRQARAPSLPTLDLWTRVAAGGR